MVLGMCHNDRMLALQKLWRLTKALDSVINQGDMGLSINYMEVMDTDNPVASDQTVEDIPRKTTNVIKLKVGTQAHI